ncbi:hypothetical protein ABFS83_06G077900 [Erythranthe nasuta]
MPMKEQMGENLLTALSMESSHFSTVLSMDSGSERVRSEFNRCVNILQLPPDINLPLSAEPSPPPPPHHSWTDPCEIFDIVEATPATTTSAAANCPTKTGKKCANAKRLDSIWGAWFFFTFYFKPALTEKFKGKIARNNGYDKSDLKLEVFLVQHDMENMYMWVFKERPENALGKMQLRSYMNGHSRQGDRPFPFSVDKGFVRSHRMQRKHYRGLSNPQCVHGIEIVQSPNFTGIDEEDRKRWKDLTGRDFDFSVPFEASDFGSWRNLSTVDYELERPLQLMKTTTTTSTNLNSHIKNLLNGTDIVKGCNKRKNLFPQGSDDDCEFEIHANEPSWSNDFGGVMRGAYGPVTAAKTIYEDEKGFLILVSLPFVDLQKVKVTWRNNLSHGIVKISCVSGGCVPVIKRQERTFRLADVAPEQCPKGEFVREICLPTRIPEDAKLEAYGDPTGTMLEILVPKHGVGPEEHEVRVSLRPSSLCSDRAYVDLMEALV